ncbi:hypothetical protein K438DRAFT_1987066 [Mycena galopus ATCC 62051]|nr:hypothetical protein K438DRAFT_1987066 [Mycena galopus ATCC 62051]
MKLFFIASSCYILYIHDPSIDMFHIEYLLRPGPVFNYHFNLTEIFGSFSIFLKSIAILNFDICLGVLEAPAAVIAKNILFKLHRTGEAKTITTHYLAVLGAYHVLYILNDIPVCPCGRHALCAQFTMSRTDTSPRRSSSDNVVDPIAVTAHIVQTGRYNDFFYVYFTKVLQGQKFELAA